MGKLHPGKVIVLFTAVLLLQLSGLSQQLSSSQKVDHPESHSFIENRGQFDERLDQAAIGTNPIRFGFEGDGQQVFLSNHKVFFNLYRATLRDKSAEEKAKRAARKKKGFESPEAFTAFEKEGRRFDYTTDLLVAEWIGANPAVTLRATEEDPFTHSYEYRDNKRLSSRNDIPSFQKVTYENLYPNIDVDTRCIRNRV